MSELLVSEKLFTFGLALVLDLQRLVEDKPAATGVSTQGRTSGLVNVEFVLKGAGDLHTNIMAHFLQECVFFNQMPIGALWKLFKNPCSQAELNKIVPFGFSLQRQKMVFFCH